MPLKQIALAVDLVFREDGERFQLKKSGRYDRTAGTEVKTGRTTFTNGTETMLSPSDEFVLDRALVGIHNAGDGFMLVDTYNGGSKLTGAQQRVLPGETVVFRLPNSTNAADKVELTLGSGSVGKAVWIAIEEA